MSDNTVRRQLRVALTLSGESFYADTAPMLEVVDGDIRVPNPLGSAVLLSLLTDRLAEGEDLVTSDGDRRGYWGDDYAVEAGDRTGSRLWLLFQRALGPDAPRQAEGYAREALAWLVEDGVATDLEVSARREGRDAIVLELVIVRDPTSAGADLRYASLWEETDG